MKKKTFIYLESNQKIILTKNWNKIITVPNNKGFVSRFREKKN